ncbi:MAG: dihydroorotate dehydrogenase electron transfer subunit [Erysipelotrichaceae bacterium]
MQEELGTIIQNILIAKDTYQMDITTMNPIEMLTGQFFNIQVEGHLLRRPISIASIDGQQKFTIIYKVVGEGTAILSNMLPTSKINVFGPLGSSYPVHNELDEVLLIGGGVGVPPLYEVAKQYRNLNKKVIVVLGFNDQASVFYEDEFKALGAEVHIACMDGSYGVKGTVMDAIEAAKITCDFVYSCGPMPMLKAVENRYTKGYTSFESRMACGMGACMACVCKDKEDKQIYYRICKDGPVFPIGKVGL